jgi:hypothetical protein
LTVGAARFGAGTLESTVLLRNGGRNHFTDIGPYSGLRGPSWDKVGWGACLFDVEHNGTLDLFVVNGHVFRNATEVFHPRDPTKLPTFAMPAQLFLGNGAGHFREISREAGPYFGGLHNGRGVAMGDYDNDGAMDIAVNECGGPAVLLHNETQTPYHWVRLQLEGSRHTDQAGSNRDAVGACVTVRAAGRSWVRHVKGGSSYLSSPDRRLLIGVGSADRVDEVEVRWPNARASTQRFGPLDVDRSYKLVEGAARAASACCPPVRRAADPAP